MALKKTSFVTVAFLCAATGLLLSGCAASTGRGRVLAEVDGEKITEADLQYSLEVAHRKENLAPGASLDLTGYLAKLVDERLVIQEARRMGLDRMPAVRASLDAFLLRESVVRLRDEEILRKVAVTPEEILALYKMNHEEFSLSLIEASSAEDARKIVDALRAGESFDEARKRLPEAQSTDMTLTPRTMAAEFRDAVLNAKPGDTTDVVRIKDHFAVARVTSRTEAPAAGLEQQRASLEKALRRQKEDARSDEYLRELRSRVTVTIDEELVRAIRDEAPKEEQEQWTRDQRPVVRVSGEALTLADFAAMLKPPYTAANKMGQLQWWIDVKAVDREALSRGYADLPEVREKARHYENQLLLSAFIQKAVYPRVALDDDTLRACYERHQNEFRRPAFYNMQQLTVPTREEADALRENLANGADFTWQLRRLAERTGEQLDSVSRWIPQPELPGYLKDPVPALAQGAISPVFEHDGVFTIVRVLGKTEEKVEEFGAVKEALGRLCTDDQLRRLLAESTASLKTDAAIEIDDQAVRSLEARLRPPAPAR